MIDLTVQEVAERIRNTIFESAYKVFYISRDIDPLSWIPRIDIITNDNDVLNKLSDMFKDVENVTIKRGDFSC